MSEKPARKMSMRAAETSGEPAARRMSMRADASSADPAARRMSMRADASGGGSGRSGHAAAEPSITMQPPALDASTFDLVAATEPLEYARVLEIYNRRVEALNQYQEALMVCHWACAFVFITRKSVHSTHVYVAPPPRYAEIHCARATRAGASAARALSLLPRLVSARGR
jgi:hypothetical protein